MSSNDTLKRLVDELYTAQNPTRPAIGDWLYAHHVYIVADNAAAIAKRFGGDPELAYAAGLLHDVADAEMGRGPDHEQRSAEIARDILSKAGYSSDQIHIAVDDALKYHSCRGDERPQTLEGKALAAGDAVAHLTTDFYDYLTNEFTKKESKEEIYTWLARKINQDFNNKIAYPEIQDEVRAGYERLRDELLPKFA